MTYRITPEFLIPKDAGTRCATCGRIRQDACLARELHFHPELNIGETLVEPRAPLFAAGDQVSCLNVVRSGYIKLFASRGSRQMVLRIAGPCSIIGVSAALFQGFHDISAESLKRADLQSIDRNALLHLMGVSEVVRNCILCEITSELRSYSDGVRRIGLNPSISGRLGSLILDLSRELGEPAGGWVRFPLLLSHEAVASMIRTTRESVTRTLKEFQRLGWIDIDGHSVTIKDADRLAVPGTVLPKAS
jgi:CRP/FNR family transcriptional regulator, cyclic AMP receptor protein